VKPIIIGMALLLSMGSAVAQTNGYAPVPKPPVFGLLTYTSAWPHLPVIEYDKWQWVYLPKAPYWRLQHPRQIGGGAGG